MTCTQIKLTVAEVGHADWALGPMEDHADSDNDEARYAPTDVPTLTGAALSFPTDDRAVPLDMLYRLEEQLRDMYHHNLGHALPRSVRSLCAKIRCAFHVTADESRMIARGEV